MSAGDRCRSVVWSEPLTTFSCPQNWYQFNINLISIFHRADFSYKNEIVFACPESVETFGRLFFVTKLFLSFFVHFSLGCPPAIRTFFDWDHSLVCLLFRCSPPAHSHTHFVSKKAKLVAPLFTFVVCPHCVADDAQRRQLFLSWMTNRLHPSVRTNLPPPSMLFEHTHSKANRLTDQFAFFSATGGRFCFLIPFFRFVARHLFLHSTVDRKD